jgi:S1/P1 Nuclease
MKLFRVASPLLLGCTLLAISPSAHAWGCKGHQVIALIAESRMTPHAREAALRILNATPVDPNLPRYCDASGLDRFADGSTWADDIRKVRPETGPWHFIDIPRGAPKSDLAKYCPLQTGCVTAALVDQLRTLRGSSATPRARADALRFIIHFVGDVHQPLHATTNNDLGGNCVLVTFFGKAPQESAPGSGSFHPNLHSIWDTNIVERLSPDKSPSDLAKDLEKKFRSRIPAWQSQPADFAAWAWESHELAEKVAYGGLPHPLPIETPRPMTACPDDKDPAAYAKMLQIDENLSAPYQDAAAPVVEEQLAKAGARLADLLNSLWP